MKSAYELAMERLQKASPSLSLTEEQKKELAEIDSKYRAKIAEKELFLTGQIRKAQTEGKVDEIDSLQKQLASEVRRLQEECEAKKKNFAPNSGKVCRASAPLAIADSEGRRCACPTVSLLPFRVSKCARDASANQDPENRACARV